jgi:hypothetical protein
MTSMRFQYKFVHFSKDQYTIVIYYTNVSVIQNPSVRPITSL